MFTAFIAPILSIIFLGIIVVVAGISYMRRNDDDLSIYTWIYIGIVIVGTTIMMAIFGILIYQERKLRKKTRQLVSLNELNALSRSSSDPSLDFPSVPTDTPRISSSDSRRTSMSVPVTPRDRMIASRPPLTPGVPYPAIDYKTPGISSDFPSPGTARGPPVSARSPSPYNPEDDIFSDAPTTRDRSYTF